MAILNPINHVELDDAGVPMISGTTMKVKELVLDHIAYGWDAKELQYQHPYLTMGQIYSALAYYSDNQAELDSQIRSDLEWVDEQHSAQTSSPFIQRLRAIKSK